jgi:hypothetical protein
VCALSCPFVAKRHPEALTSSGHRRKGGSATEDASEERPPTSLRTVAAGRPRGLFREVLVLGFLEGLASAFRQIIVAYLRRGRADRTSREFEDEGRDQKRNDHSAEDSRMRTGEQWGRVNRQGDQSATVARGHLVP